MYEEFSAEIKAQKYERRFFRLNKWKELSSAMKFRKIYTQPEMKNSSERQRKIFSANDEEMKKKYLSFQSSFGASVYGNEEEKFIN